MPQINGLAGTYGDRGLVVLGINIYESLSKVQQYQNMYPNILMLRDTSGSVWNVYKIGGYIPLNYLLKHDFDQTVDYRAEGYNHSIISNRIQNLLSDVSVKLILDSPSYHQGTAVGYTIELQNYEATPMAFYAIIDVKLQNGSYFPLYNPLPINLAANQFKSFHLSYPLPPGIPPVGTYRLRVRIGSYPPADLWMMDDEPFDIVP